MLCLKIEGGILMGQIFIKARGKINLTLDVLGKRLDGYHDLKMIMQTVDLCDDVLIEDIKGGIEVNCENSLVPNGEMNIAFKAAQRLLDYKKIDAGVRINIAKRIPVAAGMAGGSSDAAAVLHGINRLFGLGVTTDELKKIGKEIGADVPYCIQGGTMLAEGIGEILTPLTPFKNVDIVLIKPKIEVSTAWVFKNLNINEIIHRPNTQNVLDAIEENDLYKVARNLDNVLERVTIKHYPVIQDIKQKLIENGAVGSLMSGSGPTVYGIFDSCEKARGAIDIFSKNNFDCYLTKTICEEM